MRRFLAGSDSDSDEDDRRVVKSAKQKSMEDLDSTVVDLKVCSWAY